MDGAYGEETGRPRRRRLMILIVAAIIAVLMTLLWWQRMPIADRFVQRELAALHIRGSYRIGQIAVRTQRLENLVLGDPARPDLVARLVEVDLSYAGIVPRVAAVRAEGVRLYGRVDASGLHLGELDKLRSTKPSSPLGLPDIDLTLDDARARIETSAGPVGLSLRGDGNLRSGFTGAAAAVIRNASLGGCTVPRASAYFAISLQDGAPRLKGPVRADVLRCPAAGAGMAELLVNADMSFARTLDRWRGRLTGGSRAARAAAVTFASPAVDMRFEGGVQEMSGGGTLALAAFSRGDILAGKSTADTSWRWKRSGGLQAQGRFRLADGRAIDPDGLHKLAANLAGTPVGPLAQRMARGLAQLQTGNRMRGAFLLTHDGKTGALRLPSLAIEGARGAAIALSSGSSVGIGLPDGKWTLDGAITSGGGDLPKVALRLARAPGGGFSGQMFVDPYAAGGARLTLEPVRFAASPGGGTRITTRVTLDGPLPDGFVKGLDLAVAADVDRSGGLTVNRACTPVRFAALKAGAMRLDGTALRLCPVDGALLTLRGGRPGGGGTIAGLNLAGHMGEAPLRLTASSARWAFADSGFVLADAQMRIGADAEPVLLSAARLVGTARGSGIGGDASGVEAQIGAIPLLVREGNARWNYSRGALALNGRILVLDAANPDRFNPLESPDFRLSLANGRIDAEGGLRLPGHDRRIASVTVRHMLGSGLGSADFTMGRLRFDDRLQPDQITHIALGVVANVRGIVTGQGRIDWSPRRVTSSGTFATDGLDLAAAFGPVKGLVTAIRFTDLLGLVSAPGQEMRIATVHPGIEVRNGVIRYALLPGQRVSIESGHWPFSGGDLILLPSVMDMSSEKPRYLTFRVLGLQAGAFIQTLELDNISATGTFDGLLPMVFDADGGRIVGGILTARQQGMPPLVIDHIEGLDIPCDRTRQGGHLAYVGQVSNENLGTFGKLAFDALKDLQYKCLTILMDGALDGEMVTQVTFNGVNRGQLSTVPKAISKQFVNLPFLFNIRIQAPFRGLINTARSFYDPSLLIRQHLGDNVTTVRENRLAVQPGESDNMPSGERK